MNKMFDVLEYKGYHTRIEFDSYSKVLHGKIEGINDLVTFESDSVSDIENEFHKAVDDYLVFCEEQLLYWEKRVSSIMRSNKVSLDEHEVLIFFLF